MSAQTSMQPSSPLSVPEGNLSHEQEVAGQWFSNAYTYTAYSLAGASGVMQTPPNSTTLPGSSVTFTWTPGAGATAYWLDVGNVVGGNNYYQSGNLGNVTTTTVNGLPTDGSEVFATLYSMVGSSWSANAYTYYALNATSGLAQIISPTGPTLSGSTVIFTWSQDANATAYWLDISAIAPGGNDVYQSGNLGNVTSTTVYSLPATSPPTPIYVTLYSLVGGQWVSNAYAYNSGP